MTQGPSPASPLAFRGEETLFPLSTLPFIILQPTSRAHHSGICIEASCRVGLCPACSVALVVMGGEDIDSPIDPFH